MIKKIFFLMGILGFVYGKNYTLNELKQKPNSIAKDYYIYKNITKKLPNKSVLEELKPHIFRYAGKIQNFMEKYVPTAQKSRENIIVKKNPICFGYNTQNILNYPLLCQKLIVQNDFWTIKKLDETTLEKLRQNLITPTKSPQNHQQTIEIYDINDTLFALEHQKPMNYLANKNAKVFMRFWTNNQKNFDDFYANENFVNELKSTKSYGEFLKSIIISKKYPKLRKSLNQTNPQNIGANEAFYLGINALDFENEKAAQVFFQKAYEKFYMSFYKDNALFWVAYLEKNENKKIAYLRELAASNDINIYSLYAKEKLNEPFPSYENGIKNPKPSKKLKADFNIKDPFAWQNLQKKIRSLKNNKNALEELSKEFFTQETLPHFAYIDTVASAYKNVYFLIPYKQFLPKDDIKQAALILSIARQESLFIPSAISTSYALGMMQFLPFLANYTAKEKNIKGFDEDAMFDPKVAYEFASYHLNYLKKYLSSPVFIAYAYNGGIGFTRRMLKRDDIFKDGKYEPFLSMEFVPYAESRLYAKKVLANYIIYLNLLGEKTGILKEFAEINSQIDQKKVKAQYKL